MIIDMNPIRHKSTTFDDTTNEVVITTVFRNGRITHVRKSRLQYETEIQSLRDKQINGYTQVS